MPPKLQYGNRCVSSQTILLDADIPHHLENPENPTLLLIMDPQTRTAQKLVEKYLNNSPIFCPDQNTLPEYSCSIQKFLSSKKTCNSAFRVYTQILNSLLPGTEEHSPMDNRIQTVLTHLKHDHQLTSPVKTLAQKTGLSDSRLMHLFKEEIGIPIRRYILWIKILGTLKLLLDGQSFTHAAHHAGFSDSAHFSRTFKHMFGMSISAIFKNSRFIQVFSCLE